MSNNIPAPDDLDDPRPSYNRPYDEFPLNIL